MTGDVEGRSPIWSPARMLMLEKMPECSVVFVNFKSAETLTCAIDALVSHIEGGEVEVIVVNNDTSEEEDLRRLERTYPVRVVSSAENLGFGAASNTGAFMSKGRIIGFLNPDTSLLAGTFRDVSRYLDAHPGVGVVGGALISENGLPERWSAGKATSLFRILANKFQMTGFWVRESRQDAVPMEWVSGAAMFIRRDLFDRLGGFDEDFFMYFEDMDLCVRARLAGFGVVRLPIISFLHHGGGSMSSSVERKRRYFASQERYFLKHRPLWEAKLVGMLRKIFK